MVSDYYSLSTGFPLLSALIFTLPLGAACLWLLPDEKQARQLALTVGLLDLILVLAVLMQFDSGQAGFQLVESAVWIPTLNVHYLLGVDGLSVLFLPLTGLLFIGVMLTSWNSTRTMPRLYYTLLLLLQGFTLGIFCALDTVLFFFFWELSLLPLYFLISLWGLGPNRRYAAMKYTLFMLAGGVPLLFGIILLAFNHAQAVAITVPAGLSFDYHTLLTTPLAAETQTLVFLLLLLGFAVKTPLFPFHTWLPLVALEGPTPIVALLTGLKLGAYGLLRFVLPLAPEAAREFHWLLAGLGVIGILYGAVLALAQSNLRKMLAFASMSHVGLVALGIASFSLQGVQGAIFQLLNFTLVAGGIFLLTGFLQQRTGSNELISLGGAARSMPLLAAFFLLFGLAAMGVPGTSGFPAEFLILVSAITTHTGAGLAALFALVLSAAYFLSFYGKAFLGPVTNPVINDAMDLRPRELILVTLLALLILIAGIYPQGVLDLTRVAAETVIARIPEPG